MAKQNDAGVYKLKGGNWGFRYTITVDGHKKDVQKTKDENGNPLTTKKEAIRARQVAFQQEQDSNGYTKPTQNKSPRLALVMCASLGDFLLHPPLAYIRMIRLFIFMAEE